MPKFTQTPKMVSRRGSVPPELVEEYRGYVNSLEKGHVGQLQYAKTEDVALGRRALLQACQELHKPMRIRRKRGERVLQFERTGRRRRTVPSETPVAPKRTRRKTA